MSIKTDWTPIVAEDGPYIRGRLARDVRVAIEQLVPAGHTEIDQAEERPQQIFTATLEVKCW